MTVAEFNPEHHLPAAEMAAIRGPYLLRPTEDAVPGEWVRWAREVDGAGSLARSIVEAAEAKAAIGKGSGK